LVIDSVQFLQIIDKFWTTVFAVLVLLALRRWVIPATAGRRRANRAAGRIGQHGRGAGSPW
jgi:hypothetical protein